MAGAVELLDDVGEGRVRLASAWPTVGLDRGLMHVDAMADEVVVPQVDETERVNLGTGLPSCCRQDRSRVGIFTRRVQCLGASGSCERPAKGVGLIFSRL